MTHAKILIVENDLVVANNLVLLLEQLRYEIIGVTQSGEMAEKMTDDLKPDLILMNMQLRERQDGIKTGKLIREKIDIPIIYVSSNASQSTIKRAKDTGPFGYIFEPFDKTHIFAAIETAIMRHHLESRVQKSRQWLKGILTSISDGVIAIDGDGRVQFINPIAEKLTGWSATHALNQNLYSIFHLRSSVTGELVDISQISDGGTKGYFTDSEIDLILLSNSKVSVPIDLKVSSITGESGNILGTVIAFQDITSEKKAIEKIKQQASRAEALVHVAKQLNSRLELKDVLELVCRITNQVIDTSATVVFQYDNKTGNYTDVARKFENNIALAQRHPIRVSFSRTTLEKYLPNDNSVFVIQDVRHKRDIPYRSILRVLGINHLIIAPLLRNNEVIGALICGSVKQEGISDDDIMLLEGLAEHVSIAVTNTLLFEKVRSGRERQRLLSKSAVDIQEAEKRRIARELHDHLGQALTGIQFMLESTKNLSGEQQRGNLVKIQNSISEIIQQIREMSLNLRPSMLDDLGLITTLRWHMDNYKNQTGINVIFNCEEAFERFPVDIETTAYRIIQEALTNVARHSQVSEVFVGLAVIETTLWIEILDKGKGFDTSRVLSNPTSGLSGMVERADLAGGYLTINSYLDQGTQVVVTLPLTGQPLERRRNDRNNSGR
ncbi:MAG TPA: hypothetical protein DCX53_10690 [Anaerolineae bacterium]|nr:hypothetical protein [Anaerolineae bacterium]